MNTYYTLTGLGFILSFLVDVSMRNKASKRTPQKFSLWFFFEDNWDRMLISAAISVVLIQMYHVMELDLAEYEDFFAVAVGFCPDLVVGWLKRKFGFLK
jgi:hypothetical protein